MKKVLLISSICAALFFISCDNNKSQTDAHTHEDGTTHEDHDTILPDQQEFNVADTLQKDTPVHTHESGEKHSH